MNSLLKAQNPEYIGKYEVLRVLGQGSTSTVYLADDPFAHRKVALKLFDPQLLAHEGFKRKVQKIFHNEAALVGQLRHPHILEIYDAIADTQGSYLVMEYVSGGTLESYCCVDRLMPIDQVIEVVFKASRALDHAYRHGVIHRDIKPANILLTQSGDVKISDFGSAMWLESDATQLQEGGSPAYMSPEQIRQEVISEQTDIYSLGVVMYELLTGQYPYEQGTSGHLPYQILQGELTAPNLYREDIFPELERIVLKALHRDTAQRYGSWKEFGDDLLGVASRPIICQSPFESDTKKFRTLQSLKFFQMFDDVQLWEVLRFSSWRKLEAGTQIIREGDVGDSFFILAQGEVVVSRSEVQLATLGMGECFGEMLYFKSATAVRDTSVTVRQDSQVIEIRAKALRQASDACQVQFNKAYLNILDAKLSRMVQLASGQAA
ncbi:MAG: serine/threonine-protein kinase [Cyanobacteria bacterium P01_F01_bin.42]